MKIKQLHPLISCICITAYRPDLLIKSIIMFEQQNYPNLELVISYPIEDIESNKIIKHVLYSTSTRILNIYREGCESIGKARNDAITKCKGDYIAIWDDDDIYQYHRIADQFNLLNGNGRYFDASLLTNIILYDDINGTACLSSAARWGGTLLCKKDHMLKFPCRDEDYCELDPVLDFLQNRRLLLTDHFSPYLYTGVYHGTNLQNYFHFKHYVRKGHPIPDTIRQNIQNYFRQKIQLFHS
jgi:glycosyltransferase involved in cell wall biosynthesis